jgi:acetoin utilization protein AcuB
MYVGLWMTRDVTTVAPETRIVDAARLMARQRIRRLPVVSGRHVVGIVTNLDVVRAFPPHVNPFSVDPDVRGIDAIVADVMSPSLDTVTPTTPIEEAARILRRRHIGALPVVSDGALVGIVTESDLFRALIEIIGTEGVSVTFDVSDREDAVSLVLGIGAAHGLEVKSLLRMEHEGRRLAIVRLTGGATDAFVDEVWRSGHRVLSVLRSEPDTDATVGG